MKKPIHDLPRHVLPRERLDIVGVSNLTDAELLAILLGTGTRKKNVLDISSEITKKNSIKDLARFSSEDFIKAFSIGRVQAGRVVAAIELGKRIWEDTPAVKIMDPEDVVGTVEDIRTKDREYLIALYLNARHELIERYTVAVGRLNQLQSDPRDVLSKALELPCGFIILAHNHPSGDPSASDDDVQWTKRMVEACALLGITLLDHIIVSQKGHVSLRAQGVISS